jgi:cell division protein FtsZ
VACLGGGTGSGATPVFAKISQELGNITYGIFTLPFQFEGEKKMEIARKALQKTRSKLDIFSVIPNERIFRIIDKKTPLRSALSMINESLAESLEGLIDMIYNPGLINIDFADFKTVISGSLLSQKKTMGQLAYLNTVAIARRKGTIKDLIEKVLYNPLYSYSVNGAKGALLNISGEKNLSLAEVSRISKAIAGLANKEAKIIFGVSQNKKYSGIIKTTLLATGCKARMFPSKTRSAKKEIISKISEVASAIIQKEESPKDIPKKIKKKSKSKKKRKVKKRRKKASLTKAIPIIHKPKVKVSDFQGETRVRKNALQIKKEMEAEEKEILDKEKFWETPAFLRKK